MNHRFDEKAAGWDDDPMKLRRAEILATRILRTLPLEADAQVLDFGAGTGLLGMHFLERGAIVTFLDPSEGMRSQVLRKLERHPAGRGRALDPTDPAVARDSGYDLVVSAMALHHVPDPRASLEQLFAWLAPGGRLALIDLDTEDGSFHEEGETDVHLGFDRGILREWLEDLGFVDVSLETAFTIEREREGQNQEFPLFLARGLRPA
jgi:cyclopropane fatty-acyl-phospholipid synthase-like methyltransferase